MEIIKIGKPGWYGLREEGCFPTTQVLERLDVDTDRAAFNSYGYDKIVFLSQDTLESIGTGYTRFKDLEFRRTVKGVQI